MTAPGGTAVHGDFRRLVTSGTNTKDIDVEGSREYRRRVNEAIRAQQVLEHLASESPLPVSPVRLLGVRPAHSPSDSTVTEEEYAVLLAGIQLLLQSLGRDANTPRS
jgi:hypothetical protein